MLLVFVLLVGLALAEEGWLSRHLGSKSPYPTPEAEPLWVTCPLVQVHLVARHGTRYPSEGDTASFDDLYTIFAKLSKQPKYGWLHNWTNIYKEAVPTSLSSQGELDMYQLAQRMSAKYNAVLKSISFEADSISMLSSETTRASRSASAFALGLLEGRGELGPSRLKTLALNTLPRRMDTFMAVKYACDYWLEVVQNNDFRDKQMELYGERHLNETLMRFWHDLGLRLEPTDLTQIYRLCAYEIAFRNQSNTWCTFLTRHDIATLEYLDDLEDYYTYSYGNPFNLIMGCELWQNLITSMQETVTLDAPLAATFKFGHAETIQFLATLLHIFQDDEPLLADTPPQVIRHRKYKGSQLTPFGANVIFEVYQCAKTAKDTHVRLLVNERTIRIPGCEADVCTLEQLKAIRKDALGCKLKDICTMKKVESRQVAIQWKHDL
ncbi:hypothetical protein BZG36_03690 [Bifiguratus adelaidae]|uniref:Multiple inositol polyphosphate phosphatase 1 n=1 Tax=Bifiguratus adelaidae TaxID=1938954 RepID=A0A261XZ11_9FUNG|nr:hypothetical protein BZG36_03690 [Bifiguratus adelaidae]